MGEAPCRRRTAFPPVSASLSCWRRDASARGPGPAPACKGHFSCLATLMHGTCMTVGQAAKGRCVLMGLCGVLALWSCRSSAPHFRSETNKVGLTPLRLTYRTDIANAPCVQPPCHPFQQSNASLPVPSGAARTHGRRNAISSQSETTVQGAQRQEACAT